MNVADVLTDGFDRIREVVHEAADGLTAKQLAWQVQDGANSIAWLIWHLTRVQDDHIADVAGTEQVWTSGGWSDRFGLPFDDSATGYGHSAEEVAQVRVKSAKLLTDYYDAVHESSVKYLSGLSGSDLDVVIDEAWNPPVTLGVRLISVLSDDLQHAGQAAYLRGLAT
jgi:hypothetical protein